MPLLEDGNAIQLGIASVIRRVLMYDIEYRAAQVLLNAYKLALFNLKNVHNEPWHNDVVTVDPASDPENAGAATEPCTYEEQQELAVDLAAGAPSVARLSPQVGTEDAENENLESKNAGAPPLSPAFGDTRVGTDQRKEVHRIVLPDDIDKLIAKGDTEDLTEEEFRKVAMAILTEAG
jgi:hypothetical protein